jgi:DNA-directed RNA polymerase subunit RPC12/RpoP
MSITCSKCGAQAAKQFSYTQEPVCNNCFSAPGVCSGCGENFGSDANLKRVGSAKNCPTCQARLEEETDALFKPGLHF